MMCKSESAFRFKSGFTKGQKVAIQDKEGGFEFGFKAKGMDSDLVLDSSCPDLHITDKYYT